MTKPKVATSPQAAAPATMPTAAPVAAQPVEDPRNAVALALLDRFSEVKFDSVGFADVIDFLRDVSGANIFVNWRALEAAEIDRNAPVTARLSNVKFGKALDLILQDVGGARGRSASSSMAA